MRLLAIDPGPVESAYVLYDGKPLRFGKVANAEMRAIVGDGGFSVLPFASVRGAMETL